MTIKNPPARFALQASVCMAIWGSSLGVSSNALSATSAFFNRVSVFPVCSQLEKDCNTDEETAAEIVAASADGNTLIYTDSPQNQVGFVSIDSIEKPAGLGTLKLSGEPTSVAVAGRYALVAVNTAEDYINVSGELAVVDITNRSIVKTINLGGQPDSIAVSPDAQFAAIAIENERNEDLGSGEPPQAPAGGLIVISLDGKPDTWKSNHIDMTGLADLYPEDPEPEYVDINADNIAVVTLQENNHIALVDLQKATVIADFSAGTVSLEKIDASESKPAEIAQRESLADIPREPDGVSWISDTYFVTADEGDLHGGSRGYTVFNKSGEVVYSSGNTLEHLTARFGHYPDKRSENKGNEPENVDYGLYGDNPLMIVASERSSLLFVYDVSEPENPRYLQTLPAGVAPEGILTLPSRNLLVAASEKDERKDKMRSVLNIYQYGAGQADYPLIESADEDGTPISWGALSGLAVDPGDDSVFYSVPDSFYGKSRIFSIDRKSVPAKITSQKYISDSNDILAGLKVASVEDASIKIGAEPRRDVFDSLDLNALINDDKTVNLDLEGVATASDGGFWLVSEGKGTVGDYGNPEKKKKGRPVESGNLLLKTDNSGVINYAVTLPEDIAASQLRFGFEGVTESDGKVYVAFQRAWNNDENPRIGIHDPATGDWQFLYYPLDQTESNAGGWVGLSDITALGDDSFMVIERDNQGGPDAAIKRLYTFSVKGLTAGDTVAKTLAVDLMPTLAENGAVIAEKVEGLAVTSDGNIYIVNDNDGVDDSNGETRLLNPGTL